MTQIPLKPEMLGKVSPLNFSRKETLARPSGDFARILADQLAEPSEETGIPQGLPELEGIAPPMILEASGPQNRLAQALSSALDDFEAYAQCLADPSKTLRQASDLLKGVETEVAGLQLHMQEEGAPELTEIFSALSALVAVEKTKLDRGDYS